MRNTFIFLMFLLITINLYSQDEIDIFTSSTNFTSELSGIAKNESLEPVEVLTSKDIKLIGVESLPDLLNYISGVNIYKINNNSVDFSLRGFSAIFKIQPLLLIDGMEYSQELYGKFFFNNTPLNINDIEKIEVIKDPTKYVNGIESAGGIINIVTKKPELLSANNISTFVGSDRVFNSEFSINRFYKTTYLKFTSDFRKIDRLHSHKRAAKKSFFTFSSTNFIKNGRLFNKLSYFQGDYSFIDYYRVKILKQMDGGGIEFKFKNQKMFNFISDYTTPTMNLSIYIQSVTGKVGYASMNRFYSEYYKFTFKRLFKFRNFNFIPGIIGKLSNTHIASQGNGKRESLILYLNSNYRFKNFTLSGFIKNEKARDLGNELSFKTSLSYNNEEKSIFIKLGYAKNFRNPTLLSQYYGLHEKHPYKGFNVNIIINPNKELKPVKIYSTFLSFAKRIKRLTIKNEIFYNRITDFPLTKGKPELFLMRLNLTNKNFFDLTIHGIETQVKYKINKNLKINSTFYAQHFKNKKNNIQGNWSVPKYKFMTILFYDYPSIFGSLKWTYTPRIFTRCAGKSDYLSIFDFTVGKNFMKNKILTSLNIANLLNSHKKQSPYGEKLKRRIFFKIRYNF